MLTIYSGQTQICAQDTHIDGEDVICIREESRAGYEDCSNVVPSKGFFLDIFECVLTRQTPLLTTLKLVDLPTIHDAGFHLQVRSNGIEVCARGQWKTRI